MSNQKKRDASAKSIVDLCGKLDIAIETYLTASAALGAELGGRGAAQPLNHARLLAEVQGVLLVLLKNAKLPGAKARETQAKFSRPLHLAGISVMERIPCP